MKREFLYKDMTMFTLRNRNIIALNTIKLFFINNKFIAIENE